MASRMSVNCLSIHQLYLWNLFEFSVVGSGSDGEG